MSRTATAAIAFFICSAPALAGQQSLEPENDVTRSVRAVPPVMEAVPVLTEEPSIDGSLDDAAWADASVATDFVQFEPDEGAAASERTEVRVLYGVDALFVGFRSYDRSPDEIAAQLARRDDFGYSDRAHVVIDSYFDRRTAFHFAVNPLGVKSDAYRFDDTQEDETWDAVWDVATSRDSEGWTAEFRIPYSQLRFETAPEQTWGINFMREIARHQEKSVWAPMSARENALVSRFGELRGLKNLSSPRRLELLPYSVASLTRAGGDADNPFYEPNARRTTVGLDAKYGITSDLTLDLTVNPDFGQVEADPGEVNLSAFESFFSERRPFFVEGASIFNFRLSQGDGDDANESLFYSRRIGRTPQGRADAQGGWVDADQQTNILGAWKVSGKTAGGWSVGLLHAMTGEEQANIRTGAGANETQAIEPLTNYVVTRIMRDFRGGKSALGIVATGVNRDKSVADDLFLRSGGYTGGVDFRHRFRDDEWEVQGFLIGSHVLGTADAIARTQRSSARYFQRPDADHTALDPSRTSLTGWSSNFSIGKHAGGFWRFATGFQARSPGFEANDVGYMRSTDYVSPWVWAGYHHSTPTEHFNRYGINFNAFTSRTFGGERTGLGGNINLNAQLKNFWGGYLGVMRQAEANSTAALRGGPSLKTEAGWRGWGGMFSDSRKQVNFNLNNWWGLRPESESWDVGISPGVTWRASNNARVSLNTSLSLRTEDRQWVRALGDPTTPSYLLGRLDQKTVGITSRLDYTFSPDLSFQLYLQPFFGSAGYSDFKTVVDPQGDTYEDRIRRLVVTRSGDEYSGDVDGDGTPETWSSPDFNFGQFRANAVVRWEYLPGSSLFVVWSQGRDRYLGGDGSFEFDREFNGLFDQRPDNVFLVKISYWLNP